MLGASSGANTVNFCAFSPGAVIAGTQPLRYDDIINWKAQKKPLASHNQGRKSEIVGKVSMAHSSHVEVLSQV